MTLSQRLVFLCLVLASAGASAIDMKVDRVTVNTPIGGSAVAWATVTFQDTFGSVPVVFATATNSNSDPATLRIRNVTTTGFEIGVVEPQNEDGQTVAMSVDFLAAETGTYRFPRGVRMVVGAYTTSTHQGRNVPGAGWDDLNFPVTFPGTPAVLAQIQTINSQPTLGAGFIGNPSLDVAIRNVTAADMEIALERSETNNGTLVAETIGYLALESGQEVQIDGVDLKALRSANNITGWDNGCITNAYSSGFSATPLVIATKNTRNGSDGGWARICSKSATEVGITIDEDQAEDDDRAHTAETAGIIAIGQAFNGSRNSFDVEAGTVNIPGTLAPTSWTSVSFPNPFNFVPHIFALPTDQGAAPAAIRLRNISNTGFEIAAVEPSGSPASHPQMDVDYVAIIPGDHTLPSGDVFEVGSVLTTRYQAGLGGSTGTETVNFNNSNSGGSTMLLQIQTIENEPALDPNIPSSPWMVTATTSLGTSSATVALERAEATAGSITLSEQLAYFVVRDGANDTLEASDGGGVDYEMFLTSNSIQGFDEGCFNADFSESYASPFAIATQSSRAGNNGGWVRRCNLESGRIGLVIDEDQSNDSERSHTREEVSVFVFSRAFETEFNTIDHYAIFHSGSGVTCEAETITIAAHDAAELGVEAGGRSITINATSTTPGWVPSDARWSISSGAGVFSTPSSGSARYTFATGESSVQLLLANTSEADIDIDVIDDDPGLRDQDGIAEDPILQFVSSGFRFYNDADGDGNADGTAPIASPLTAGLPSGQLILRGIATDGSSGACAARVSGPQVVSMGYECVNPVFCFREDDALINGTAIQDNDLGSGPAYNNVSLNFDAQGQAAFNLEYFDAGIIRLYARLALPASGGNPAITLSGTSDETIVRPADLFISVIANSSGSANPETTATGAGFTAANTPFTVIVQARNADGDATPNFGGELAREGVTLRPLDLVMPDTGSLPALVSADTFSGTGAEGEFENRSVRWPEVGSITMRAEIRDGDYLGTGNIEGTVSATVGRFYPDHLQLVSATLSNGCSSGFTYMSDRLFSYRPIDLSYRIEAVTAGLTRLGNYQDNFPTASFIFDAENVNDGNNLNTRLNVPSASWAGGLYEVNGVNNTAFARAGSGATETPDGPYSAMRIGLRTNGSDPDGVNFLPAAQNFNASNASDCSASGSCNAVALGGALDIRFGRLAISNVHGPETSSLEVPFEVQQWDPVSGFIRNTSDNCTQIAMSDIRFAGNSLTTDANRNVSIGSATTTGAFDLFTPGLRMSFSGGNAGLNFSAPGAGNSGAFDVDILLSSLPWLRSDWNNNGNSADDAALPSAEIQFGRYRGHDRVIFWREVLD